MSMTTEGIVITVKKLDKTYSCVDQFGNEHPEVPDWRWRRAYKGDFKLIQKFDRNNKSHWKRYYEEYDGPVSEAKESHTSTPSVSYDNTQVQAAQL